MPKHDPEATQRIAIRPTASVPAEPAYTPLRTGPLPRGRDKRETTIVPKKNPCYTGPQVQTSQGHVHTVACNPGDVIVVENPAPFTKKGERMAKHIKEAGGVRSPQAVVYARAKGGAKGLVKARWAKEHGYPKPNPSTKDIRFFKDRGYPKLWAEALAACEERAAELGWDLQYEQEEPGGDYVLSLVDGDGNTLASIGGVEEGDLNDISLRDYAANLATEVLKPQ